METNLVDLARRDFTPGLVHSMSTIIGETPDTTLKLIDDALPSVFAGMAAQSASEQGATRLYGLAKEGVEHDGIELMSNLQDTRRVDALDQEAERVVHDVLGDDAEPISAEIASHIGVNRSVAARALAFVSPIALATLGKQILAQGLNVSGLASLLGVHPSLEIDERRVMAATRARNRIRWLLLGLGLLCVVWALLVWRIAKPTPRAARPIASDVIETPPPPMAATEAPIPPPAPIIAQDELSKYLSMPDPKVPKRFVYEDLNFPTGSATLAAEAQPTVDTIAGALVAHPSAVVRIEGFTDTVGTNASNQTLALRRADSLRTLLVERGIAPERISSTGYGPEQPIGSNQTVDGRAQNRRIELVVVKP